MGVDRFSGDSSAHEGVKTWLRGGQLASLVERERQPGYTRAGIDECLTWFTIDAYLDNQSMVGDARAHQIARDVDYLAHLRAWFGRDRPIDCVMPTKHVDLDDFYLGGREGPRWLFNRWFVIESGDHVAYR